MDNRWTQLGAAFAASRRSQNLTQDDVAARTGVAVSTIQAIDQGGPFKGITASMRLYAVVLSWAPGSIEAVLDGGKPKLLEAPQTSEAGIKGLPYRMAQALADGTALDTRFRSIGPHGEIVMLLKGREGASPEELGAILREWERLEGHLDRLGEVADETSDNQ
ncbi:helix-turn-helix domain-containing protein [Streptomyces sp. NPDC021224]|uniref:helix-turn-helix domain-containing protein n=1 Tax=unclassified Streptomyces TaxID=2593676 RepID=UPI0037AF67DA